MFGKISFVLLMLTLCFCAPRETFECKVTYWKDFDGDGWSDGITSCEPEEGYRTEDELYSTFGDCDDADRNTNPSAVEVCDGKDNNCDGRVDEGCPEPVSAPLLQITLQSPKVF